MLSKKYQNNENITLYIDLEKNVVNGLEKYINTKDEIGLIGQFSPPGGRKVLQITREMSLTDLNDLDMSMMPGFKIKWNYSHEDNGSSRLSHSTTFKRS